MASQAEAQFGFDATRVVKRVKWYNRESTAETIYEGQPVCYMFDTTNNILGYDKANSTFGQSVTEAATTAEGYQNEGKFLIVEKPYTDNLMWFAGVVAPGNWCGKSVAATSYQWLEIFVPNGAIVAVRTNQSTTTGLSVLSLISDAQYLGAAAAGRPVALAAETVDRSSTNGIVLAKLDPNLFLWEAGSAALKMGAGTAARVANSINVTTAQTAGRFSALEVISASTSTVATSGYGAALYTEHTWAAAPGTGQQASNAMWTNITAGTHTEAQLFGLEIGMWESGATISGISQVIAPLCLRTDFAQATGAGTHYMMYLRAETASDAPDGLFMCYTARAIGMVAQSSASVAYVIPIKMQLDQSAGPAAGTYYIMVSATA